MKLAVVIMGVSGCGKSTFAKKLAGIVDQREAMRSVFIEGDDLHSDSSKCSMAQGIPLTDTDREPWFKRIAASVVESAVVEGDNTVVIVACSALKRKYRDTLRDSLSGCEVRFVYLKVGRDVLVTRLQNREGHFAGVSLLQSQLDTLEEPVPSIERDVVIASDATSVDDVAAQLLN
ncbi:gluconokinase [Chytriomyces cf. hyalinus JEL632]|nr:gluconokinase [Chytriomyces cf. hyalinus JEL632]